MSIFIGDCFFGNVHVKQITVFFFVFCLFGFLSHLTTATLHLLLREDGIFWILSLLVFATWVFEFDEFMIWVLFYMTQKGVL